MRFIKLFFSLLFLAPFCFSVSCKTERNWKLLSEDKNIKVELILEQGEAFYAVSIKREADFEVVIQKSPLGIIRQDADFTKDLVFTGSSEVVEIDEK